MLLWLFGVLLVGSAVLVSLVGLSLVRRRVSVSTLREHHDVAGFIIAVLGVIYAVLLALIIVVSWESFEAAKVTVEREANGLADLFRFAEGLPAPIQEEIQEQARAYAQTVLEEEWTLMARGDMSRRAVGILDGLWLSVTAWEPSTARESALYEASLAALRDLNNDRRLRALESREGFPPLLWFVLYAGATLTVGFTYFFGVENHRFQALMTALLTASIALVLFLGLALEHPFRGGVRVQPEAFHNVLVRMDEITQAQAARPSLDTP